VNGVPIAISVITSRGYTNELLSSVEPVADNDDTNLEDDHNSRALVMYGERKIYVTPSVASRSHHKQPRDHIDTQRKVRKLLQL
jgi:euchromatic histone-lysine N-methyltransferase